MSSRNWIEEKLEKCAYFQEGYVNPSKKIPEYFGEEVKWIRANDLNDSYVHDTTKKLSKKGFESAGKSALLFKPNTIVISKSGTIGRLGIIKDYMCGNRATINIVPITTICELKYLFYWLLRNQKIIEDMAVGSVQKNLYVSLLSQLRILLPPLSEQKAIVKVLSDLDDKIELNNEMNKTLEEFGQALFKRWFIDFEFPDQNGNPYRSSDGEMVYSEVLGKEIPKGWKVKRLDDLADFLKGKRSPAEFYVNKNHPEAKPYIRIADFGDSHVTVYTKADWCLECIETDTLLATDGSIGLSDFGWKGVLTHHILCIRPKKELIDPYLIFTIIKLNEKYLASCNTASVSPTLRQDYVKSILLPYPPINIMKKYGGLSEAIRLLIYNNKNENKSLSELRDSLLPKLMGGEIRVPLEASQ